MMNKAYIALGSNINPRYTYLKQAREKLIQSKEVKITKISSIYETVPVGYTEQGNFLNMVIKIETKLTPFDLLMHCQSVERLLGRKREQKWGPRTLDLDILLFNHENIETTQLILPHPRMHERAFVLIPMADVNAKIKIPGIDKSVNHLLMNLPIEEKRGVVRWVAQPGEEE